MPFSLNERLKAGGIDFGRHGLCRVLLKNNATLPMVHPRSRSR